MGWVRRMGVGSLCLVAVLGLASAASAQPSRSGRGVDVRFDVHLSLGWYSEFGIGGRVDIAIIPDGFLRPGSIEDDFTLSFGIDVFFWNYYGYDYCHHHDGDTHCHGDAGGGLTFAIPAAAQWNLYLSRDWSIFPEGGIAIINGDHWRGNFGHGGRRFYIDPYLGFGARYHFSERNALLFRVSWPAGFQIGITF